MRRQTAESSSMGRDGMKRHEPLLALLVFGATVAILQTASRTQGNTRDEGYYFDAAEQYYAWYGELGDNLVRFQPLKSFERRAIDRWFSYNHEHPALMKTLFGFSWRLLHRCHCPADAGRHPIAYPQRHATLALLSEQQAMRLPTHLLIAAMVLLVYFFGARAWSRRAGLLAAGLSLLAPRFFFDAELACFDGPVAALWLATCYAYWRSLEDRRFGAVTGIVFGLALATKHNAFFLPVVLLVHYFWIWRRAISAGQSPPPARAFVWMALLAPLVYFACWPWLWFNTVARFREYVAFHVHHVYYNMEYFGRNYNKPPFPLSFPYVMTLLTLPVTTLVLAVGGAGALLRARPAAADPRARHAVQLGHYRGDGVLVGLNALFPMAILTLTRAPIFGATKHFDASIPFLALLAGYGFHAVTAGRRRALTAAMGAFFLLPAALETYRSHPYALTHYNMLAGGPAGGADLGMNRQFWGQATRGLLPWLNAHAPTGAPVYWHDTNQAQLNMYIRDRLLRSDLGNTGLEQAGVRASNFALVLHEKHFNKYEHWIWDFYDTTRPVQVLTHEGVPIVTLYQRPPHGR